MAISKEHLLGIYETITTHTKHFDRVQSLVTVIEIKQNTPSLKNTKRSLYLDTKDMLMHYVQSRDGKDYGYDQLDNDFIIDYIEQGYFSARQQISLYNKIEAQLRIQAEDYGWIQDRILKLKLMIFRKENWIKFIIVLSGKNKISSLTTLFVLFCLECLCLLPIADEEHALFSLQQSHYCDNEIINYVTNIWALRLEWIDGPQLSCISVWGVVLITFWLTIYLVFVANIVFKNLFDRIDIYEISE